jgi:hypothetical protein
MMRSEEFYRDLDPGIRFAVRVLHANGIDTCQSCQGYGGHAYLRPTVEMISTGSDAQGFQALACLALYGLPVDSVAIVWHVTNGLPHERLWRIEFYAQMLDRANDRPNFIWEYQGCSKQGEYRDPDEGKNGGQ